MSKKKKSLTAERTAYKPFQYPKFYDAWLKHETMHWLPREINFLEDIKDWKTKLSKDEKKFVTQIFRFFTQGDIDVASGYVNYYLPIFPAPEVRMMLLGFAAREAVHIDAYAHLIETLGLPETIYNAFLEYDAMKDKHEFLTKRKSLDVSDPRTIATNIAVFSAFAEGVQLFSSFVMLLNFPRRGLLKNMGKIISWSLVDETTHFESMIELFRTYIGENIEIFDDDFKKEIYTIAEKMIELEDKFIDLAYTECDMEGLPKEDLKTYIRYIADRRLISLGMKGIFKVKKNPLPWVEQMISAKEHGNFFEGHVTEYAKGALSGSWGDVWGKAE